MNGPIVRELSADEVRQRHAELAAFERGFVYPLGRDHFHLDHGSDYLAFFRRLGRAHAFVAEVDGGITGMLVLVRRTFAGRDVWYLCDLKVTRGPRSAGVVRRLLRTAAAAYLRADEPAFGVSMNGGDGANRLVRAALRCTEAGPLRTTPLVLFSCDLATWRQIEPPLTAALGPLHLHTTTGEKDIVLASTGRPMPLLHVWHGPEAPATLPAQPGAVHMFCLPANDPLHATLQRAGVRASATATVVHRHMDNVDWRGLRTSDI